jgi:hypothetical protein
VPTERAKIRKALTDKCFLEVTNKKTHDFYYLIVDGRKQPVFTRLSRGTSYRDYSDGLVSNVAKQIGLTKPEFLDYVDCKLELVDYLQLLRGRSIIR